MVSAAATRCANHRKRERVAVCCACGDDLCVECVVHTAVGVKCKRCTGEMKPRRGGASRRPKAPPEDLHVGSSLLSEPVEPAAPPKRRRPWWALPLALLGLVAIVGSAVALLGGGGSGDSGPVRAGGGEASVRPTTEVTERVADFTGAGGVRLGATLTIPAGVGAKAVPGVVIVPGGATSDRNGLVTRDKQPDPLYQDLSKSLAEAGIVSLRYDRRGTGQSTLAAGQNFTMEELVTDAKAGLDFLAQRRETSGAPLGLVAYDSGGFVAMTLAAGDPRVKSLVLISTPGRPMVDVLAEDFVREVPDPARGQALADAVRTTAAQVVSSGQIPPAETMPPELRAIFAPDVAGYLRGLLTFDPAVEATRVRVPTLVVRGANDTSVTELDVASLRQSLLRSDVLVSPLGSNSLALPPGQEGSFHNPARHGSTRDGDALAGINNWLKGHLAA